MRRRRFPARSPMRQVWSTALVLGSGSIAMGTVFLVSSRATASPAFDPVRSALPIRWWGWAFVAMGLAILWCLFVPHTTRPAAAVLIVTGSVHAAFAFMFVNAWIDHGVGVVGAILWVKVACLHFILAQAAAKRAQGGLYSRDGT